MKKGAMFGLESRALKKQFGKLFLVRMQSVGSQETRVARIQSNRAAMFGLDARIALAIFGALSVISGAALYSAIQEANVIRIISEMKEIEKAYESFYLDTGSHVKQHVAGADTINIEELLDNTENRSGWLGPYVSYDKSSIRNGFLTEYNDLILRVRTDDITWGHGSSNSVLCSDLNKCFIWVGWLGVPDDIADAIDKKIDGTLDHTDGDVRYLDWTPGVGLYIKTQLTYKDYK